MVEIANKGDTRQKMKWFPGHMKKALDDIEANKIKLVDAILYVIDSRAPYSCINPNINKIVHGKPVIFVLNKCDLADEKRTAEIKNEFADMGRDVLIMSANSNQYRGSLKNAIKGILSEKMARNQAKSVNIVYKILILGVPNTGKSTLINMLSGSKKALTGNIAGVTKSNSWLKIDDMFMMLDTPGVLWPNVESELSKNLAFIGSLSDKEFDMADLGFELMKLIFEKYPDNIKARYDIDYDFEDFIELYDRICEKRGFIMRGGEIDYSRAGRAFIDEFRSGKLGRITLE